MTVGKPLKLSLIRDVVGLSSSIFLEAVYERTQLLKTERQKRTTESGSKYAVSVSQITKKKRLRHKNDNKGKTTTLNKTSGSWLYFEPPGTSQHARKTLQHPFKIGQLTLFAVYIQLFNNLLQMSYLFCGFILRFSSVFI